jgi:hypothetical protein
MSSKNTMYLMNSSNTDGALDMGNKGDREIALTEYNHNGIVDEIFCEPPSLLNNYMIYYVTTKFSILTFMKGGTSRIGGLLEHNKNISKYNSNTDGSADSLGIDWIRALSLHEDRIKLNQPNRINPSEPQSHFNSTMLGASENDFVVVIRNPRYKWLSGVLQDLRQQNSNDSLQPSLIGFLVNKYPTLSEIFKDPENMFIEEVLNNEPDAFYDLFKHFLLGHLALNKSVTNHHSKLYNEVTYKLLQLNTEIDETKLKILDLDSVEGNIDNVFKHYYPDLDISDGQGKSTQRKKYEPLLIALKRFENEYPIYMSMIQESISRDFFYYKLIKQNYGKQIFR